MRLTLLHSDSLAGSCPSVWETDNGWLVILGQRLTDHQGLSDLTNILPGETPMVLDRELFLRAAGRLTA